MAIAGHVSMLSSKGKFVVSLFSLNNTNFTLHGYSLLWVFLFPESRPENLRIEVSHAVTYAVEDTN